MLLFSCVASPEAKPSPAPDDSLLKDAYLSTDHPGNSGCAVIFILPPLTQENALEIQLSHGQKQNTSQECCLQYSSTFSHLQLQRENATASDFTTLQHALNPNKEGEAVANRLFFISAHF